MEYYTDAEGEKFADNYIDYKFEGQTRDALQNALESAFESDVKLSFGVGTKASSGGFDDSSAFEEYIGSAESNIGFNAVVLYGKGGVDEDKLTKRLLTALKKDGIAANGDIYFAAEASVFKPLEALTTEERHSLRRFTFSMTGLDEFDSYKWR